MIEIAGETYLARANAHIALSNSQLKDAPADRVSDSMAQAAARFDAWVWGQTVANAADMQARRQEAFEHFNREMSRKFLAAYDDYVANYDQHFNVK